MNASNALKLALLSLIVEYGCCTVLASAGYFLASPSVRNFLIRTGFSTLIRRKADTLYDYSNFRQKFDQGTGIRKAVIDGHDIVELSSNGTIMKRTAINEEEGRVYSERLFNVLHEMDRNTCASRLLCEIGADPKEYGVIGFKIHFYLKSVPPVTRDSFTSPYVESFHAGMNNGKDVCVQHYEECRYDLKNVMKFLMYFTSPVLKKSS